MVNRSVANVVEVDDIYLDQCELLKPNITTILNRYPIFEYHGKYYMLDEFAFYDSFRLRLPIREIVIACWIVLGLLWLCLDIRNFRNKTWKEVKGQTPEIANIDLELGTNKWLSLIKKNVNR